MSDEQSPVTNDELPFDKLRAGDSRVTNYELRIPKTKRCGRCKRIKPIDAFGHNRSRSDGRSWRCKVCNREAAREYYAKHGARLLARRRELYARDGYSGRLRRLRYHQNNREIQRLATQRYRRKNLERIRARSRRYYVENLRKVRAHTLLRQALTYGDVQRAECEICTFLGLVSNWRKTVAHHEDYERPLDVRWLCHAHHRQLHAGHFSLLPSWSIKARVPDPSELAFTHISMGC